MPRPDQQAPHNPKVPPVFDNGDAQEPLNDQQKNSPASPAGDARTGSHGGEVGQLNEGQPMDRTQVRKERPKEPM